MCRILTRLSSLILGLYATSMGMGLQIGDPAPALRIAEWAQGQAVDLSLCKGKNLVVVEFWGTRCPACVESIHHLNETKKRLEPRGVIMVSISADPVQAVKSYLKGPGSQIEYTVAVDDRQATIQSYMVAFGENRIPCAFIVDLQGRIAWQGSPMMGMDEALDALLAGTYDLAEAKRVDQARRLVGQYLETAARSGDAEVLKKMSERILSTGHKNAAILEDLAWGILMQPGLRYRDLPLALRASKMAMELKGGMDVSSMDTHARALFANGRIPEAIELEKKAIASCTNERMLAFLEQALREFESQLQRK